MAGMRCPLLAAFALALVALAAPPGRAGQDDPRLDGLFNTLQNTHSETEARATERQIWQIWTEHKNPEIERLMQHGIAALSEDDQDEALAAFNEVVEHDKNFAEGWNKRATVEFVMGDYSASVEDIERTLALEPRHFGALSGLGQIYLALDRKPLALKAFQAALAINPHLDGLHHVIEELQKSSGGSPI